MGKKVYFSTELQYNKEWTKANVVDMNSLEIKALKSWIDKNLLTNPKVTIIQSQKLLQFAQKSKDTAEIAYAANSLGLSYLYDRNYEKALHYLNYAIEMDLIVDSPLLATHYRKFRNTLLRSGLHKPCNRPI